MLQLHLFSSLRVLKGKQQDMIAKGIVGFEHLKVNPLFPYAPSGNTFKRHRGILEPHVQNKNHLKEKTIKHMCI
jgi:hypothetical protein